MAMSSAKRHPMLIGGELSLPQSVFYNTLRVSPSLNQLKGRSGRARVQRQFPGTHGTRNRLSIPWRLRVKTGVARHPLPHP